MLLTELSLKLGIEVGMPRFNQPRPKAVILFREKGSNLCCLLAIILRAHFCSSLLDIIPVIFLFGSINMVRPVVPVGALPPIGHSLHVALEERTVLFEEIVDFVLQIPPFGGIEGMPFFASAKDENE
jgi:hypothetical protein